jgi:polysaccharide deacetylase family protein (PEP-CTERM system associated)
MIAAVDPAPVINALTVDVEDYFQAQALADSIPRDTWESMPRRVEANTDRLLEAFDRAGAKATFFTLGWVAERHPMLIRRIVAAGHELASHGYGHDRVDRLSRSAFRADVGRARRILQDAGGVAVAGYRAPTFSICPQTPWAFAVLESEGYLYSSSVYPVRHDLYGMPGTPRFPYRPADGAVWEIPLTTVRMLGRNLPCAGGGYFRLVPYQVFHLGLRRFHRDHAAPGVFYTHPWEFDPAQPRVRTLNMRSRFRHYVNLSRTAARLELLLREFAWDRMDQAFAEVLALPRPPEAQSEPECPAPLHPCAPESRARRHGNHLPTAR